MLITVSERLKKKEPQMKIQGKSLQEWIAEQKNQHEEASAKRSQELARLAEACAGAFPDLQRHVNRWGRERFSSKKANTLVTDYDLSHNCGCCSDSPLELWPFMVHESGMSIYSEPPCFSIGEKCGFGDRPGDGWRECLLVAGIPEAILDRVQKYFDDNPPVWENEDEE